MDSIQIINNYNIHNHISLPFIHEAKIFSHIICQKLWQDTYKYKYLSHHLYKYEIMLLLFIYGAYMENKFRCRM